MIDLELSLPDQTQQKSPPLSSPFQPRATTNGPIPNPRTLPPFRPSDPDPHPCARTTARTMASATATATSASSRACASRSSASTPPPSPRCAARLDAVPTPPSFRFRAGLARFGPSHRVRSPRLAVPVRDGAARRRRRRRARRGGVHPRGRLRPRLREFPLPLLFRGFRWGHSSSDLHQWCVLELKCV